MASVKTWNLKKLQKLKRMLNLETVAVWKTYWKLKKRKTDLDCICLHDNTQQINSVQICLIKGVSQ